MEWIRALRLLWRHGYFRKLMAVRIATQSCDGLLQVALASYVLFSPERQPDAGSIAAVLAITLLPFSVLGPFVGVILDRWSRRQVLVVVDLIRAVLVLGLAALVATGLRTGSVEALFYGGVLLAMSLNRFLLAALSAALPHTIEPTEYMVANSVVPTVGPAGALVGAALGTLLRLVLGSQVPSFAADATLFIVACGGYVLSACLALRIPRDQLGPDERGTRSARDVIAGLAVALRHLRERRAAGIGLLTIGLQRLIFGVVTVATILIFRNHFHSIDDVNPAIADLGLFAVITGAGFVVAAAITPLITARAGVRAWVVAALLLSAVLQVFPGAIYTKVTLMIAAFLLGVTAQSVKICVDTLVQAHVDDDVKGRAFVIYDMIFNVALVAAACITALIMPPDGRSVPVLIGLAACYALIGVAFLIVTRGLDLNAGTESMREAIDDEAAAEEHRG
ncbi:MFS transporter [Microlunatus parietis]|uniref:MFS family permease n=1 Tax=Microlunatus parietis TaxID=682979 RepID=A0A7Y9I8C0_9ACTN|nr:MFS transporter [Microlunatus parietis]NYE72183.1 MFS family permease [Microlunatus parietis]